MIVAAIPLKRLAHAKSRLANRLSAEERTRLVTSLTEHTVRVVQACPAVERVVLLTAESDLARRLGIDCLPDRGGLNGSVRHAAVWAMEIGAGGLLVVPIDLPWLSVEDVAHLVAAAGDGPSVTLARTRDGGTGALLLQPPGVICPAFGPESFERHREAALRARVAVTIVERDGFAAEVDTAGDLDALCAGRRV